MSISITELASLLFSMSRVMRQGGGDPFSQIRLEALAFIESQKDPTMKDIAQYFSIKPPTATSLVNGLVNEKYLARVTDRNDRRIVRITLTAKGKRELSEGHRRKLEKIERKFSPLNAKEREALAKILTKIIDHHQSKSQSKQSAQ